ncbi:3968_t:CDS:2, partial [Funneliformis geosporum]
RSKRGYYVRRVKESLWSTFVYDDLYKPIDPEDTQADTYISLIIKSIFTVKKECIQLNRVWIQLVLKVIFDEKHLSSKIDSDIVENWTEVISDTKMPSDQFVDDNNNISSKLNGETSVRINEDDKIHNYWIVTEAEEDIEPLD